MAVFIKCLCFQPWEIIDIDLSITLDNTHIQFVSLALLLSQHSSAHTNFANDTSIVHLQRFDYIHQ